MTRLPMSRSAAALLRALLANAQFSRDRILLTESRSTDWQSLTFVGERHELRFRIAGPDAQAVFDSITAGLSEAELAVPNQIVADIALAGPPEHGRDGSIGFAIEALTVEE